MQKKFFLITCFLVFVIYGICLFFPFVHDDFTLIVNNPNTHHLNWAQFFAHTIAGSDRSVGGNHYYRPLLEVLYFTEFLIFGGKAWGFHLVNVLLHLLNGWLIFGILNNLINKKEKMGDLFFVPYAVTGLFLIHPVQTEAVACISGISNLLSVFFCLISFYLYMTAGSKAWRWGGSLLFFALALLSKEQSVVLPFLMLGYEMFYFSENSVNVDPNGFPTEMHPARWYDAINRRFIKVMPFAGVLIAYFLIRVYATQSSITQAVFQNPFELWLRLKAIPITLLSYIQIILFPFGLHYYRNTNILSPALLPFLLCVVLGFVVIYYSRHLSIGKKRLIGFGMMWFFINLLPTLNFFPIINEYSFIMSAEHFLYLALVGLSLAILVLASEWFQKIWTNQKILISVMLVLSLWSFYQVTFWRSEVVLFERMVKFEPQFGRGRILLGQAYLSAGRPDQALSEYKDGLKIMERYYRSVKRQVHRKFFVDYIKKAHFGMGQSYMGLKKYVLAIGSFQKVLDWSPHGESQAGNWMGYAYFSMKDLSKAQSYFLKAIEWDHRNIEAWKNLAVCYLNQNRRQDALNVLNEAIRINPQSAYLKGMKKEINR